MLGFMISFSFIYAQDRVRMSSNRILLAIRAIVPTCFKIAEVRLSVVTVLLKEIVFQCFCLLIVDCVCDLNGCYLGLVIMDSK